MQYLKIENEKGYYQVEADTWKPIDELTKEDLLTLLNASLTNDFEMDELKLGAISNPAHQIIYKHIYEKLSELITNKNRFSDEAENLFKEAIQKYSS